MHRVPDGYTQRTGKQADQRELKGVSPGDGSLAQAQHAQHGTVIQMAGRKAPRRQCYSHRAEQGCQ